MATRYKPRAFGGPVPIKPLPPPINVTFYVRQGNNTVYVREGNSEFYVRQGNATAYTRE